MKTDVRKLKGKKTPTVADRGTKEQVVRPLVEVSSSPEVLRVTLEAQGTLLYNAE